jgi:hypothetical protein
MSKPKYISNRHWQEAIKWDIIDKKIESACPESSTKHPLQGN